MSAEIDSSETILESHDADAADFLLANSKFHDCHLVVGNPDTDEVDTIGAASLHLIAHSPVLREMIESSRAEDAPESSIHVTDVSPATFKLMLRFVYGGKLPRMTAIEAAGLALCADKFKIPRLVRKALKRLDPTSAEDVFPALICVSFIKFPDLELKVRNIVQKETDKIVGNSDFLELEEDCVIFILKQNTLNISELELWKSVVRWAEYQVKMNPSRTIRDCLLKIFGYLRFLTLPLEDLAEHVLPTKIITPEEFVDLTLTVMKKQTLESSLLCRIQERRGLYKEEDVNEIPPEFRAECKTKDAVSLLQDKSENVTFGKACIFRLEDYYDFKEISPQCVSTLVIKPRELVEIVSFTCRSINERCGCRNRYCYTNVAKVVCHIVLTKMVNDIVVSEEVLRVENEGVEGDYVILPLKLKNGDPLILNPEETCTFTLNFNCYLYAFSLDFIGLFNLFSTPLNENNISFKNNESSVVHIDYRKL